MSRTHSFFVFLLLIILSLFAFSINAQSHSHGPEESAPILPEAGTRYVCPMHSHIVRDHEGNCPICGMALVARKTSAVAGDPQSIEQISGNAQVVVSGNMQQAMALSTEAVRHSKLWRFIKTYGSVQFDETGLTHLHPRASGWIEKLTVNSLGQRVDKGELLYEIYSPDLLVAQEDFLSLLSTKTDNPVLLERGRQRLRLLGLTDPLIKTLEERRAVFYKVPYYAQEKGIVSALEVREGMYAQANTRIMTLADLSRVWVIADVFEHQINWVEVGKSIELDLPALELYGLEGRVEFVYPTLDPMTRTLKVRLALENPNEMLKPDMLATVRIYAGPVEAINISVDALIQTEKHNRVFVQKQDLTFERRDVEVGIITNGRAEIRSGLQVGEKVVTSGQFLLDAEASLSNTTFATSDNPHLHH